MTKRCEGRPWSKEWMQDKVGHASASRMVDVMAKLKGKGEAAARRNYRIQLVAERLTNVSQEDTYVSPRMQWGIEQEAFARSEYEIRADCMTDLVGFGLHETIEHYGASPDGLVGKNGLLELKCPDTSTHITWILEGVVPEEHQPQMFAQMDVWERDWCDFVSFDPRVPKNLQLFTIRLPRDEMRIAELRDGVIQFNAEVDALIAKLREWKG